MTDQLRNPHKTEAVLPGRHLRRSARDARAEHWMVELSADDADAIADVLDAAHFAVYEAEDPAQAVDALMPALEALTGEKPGV